MVIDFKQLIFILQPVTLVLILIYIYLILPKKRLKQLKNSLFEIGYNPSLDPSSKAAATKSKSDIFFSVRHKKLNRGNSNSNTFVVLDAKIAVSCSDFVLAKKDIFILPLIQKMFIKMLFDVSFSEYKTVGNIRIYYNKFSPVFESIIPLIDVSSQNLVFISNNSFSKSTSYDSVFRKPPIDWIEPAEFECKKVVDFLKRRNESGDYY